MLTNAGIESMGFVPINPEEPIEAYFYSLRVFGVRGINIDTSGVSLNKNVPTHSLSCQVAIGNSLNALSEELLGSEFVSNETAWMDEHKAKTPFLFVLIGPTEPYVASKGYWMRPENQALCTYNTFDTTRLELAQCCEQIVPKLVASLALALTELERPVTLHPLTTMMLGKTKSGEIIHDFHIELSASGYASRTMEQGELESRVDLAIRKLNITDSRALSFYYQGFVEEDPLKSFLFYFLSIEIYVQKCYKKIKPTNLTSLSPSIPPTIMQGGSTLIQKHLGKLADLGDKFVICAMYLWQEINDTHIATFRDLKKIRDNIAHGKNSEFPPGASEMARDLASIVLGT